MIDPKYYSAFNAAIQELAVRYNLPEFTGSSHWITQQKENITTSRKVTPTGQLSAIVSELEVEVNITTCALDGIFSLEMYFNYKHFSSGSNGKSHNFYVVTQENVLYGDELPLYLGIVDSDCLHEVQRSINRKLENELKAKEA